MRTTSSNLRAILASFGFLGAVGAAALVFLQFAASVTGVANHLGTWAGVATVGAVLTIASYVATVFGRNLRLNLARSQQSEAKANLTAAYTALKAWHQSNDRYPDSLRGAGFDPLPSARYVYFASLGELFGGQHDKANPQKLAVEAVTALEEHEIELPALTPTSFRVVAARRLRGQLDVWIISDLEGKPRNVVPGLPPRKQPDFQDPELAFGTVELETLRLWAAQLEERVKELKHLLREANERLTIASLQPIEEPSEPPPVTKETFPSPNARPKPVDSSLGRVTPSKVFEGPILAATISSGGSVGITDLYVYIRDVVSLGERDWEANPLERRLARWHTSLARAINDLVRKSWLREDGHARWAITEKGARAAQTLGLVSKDGALIDRSSLRKRLEEIATKQGAPQDDPSDLLARRNRS